MVPNPENKRRRGEESGWEIWKRRVEGLGEKLKLSWSVLPNRARSRGDRY